jgi:hypothetical protein
VGQLDGDDAEAIGENVGRVSEGRWHVRKLAHV